MKTTIELPDDTVRRAKILAAERRTTLRDLFTEALERFLDNTDNSDQRARRADLKRLLARMQASNTEPMRPLGREEAHER